MRFLLILFIPRLSKASSLNLTLLPVASAPWASCWPSSGLYHVSVFLLYQEIPCWTHYFIQDLMIVKGRRIVPSSDPLALPFLLQASMQRHTTDMFNLLFTRTASSFPGEPARVQLFSCLGLIQPRCSFCAFLCWTARVFSWPISPACWCPPEWQLCPPE